MPTVSNEFIVDGAYIKIANRRKLCDCGLTAKWGQHMRCVNVVTLDRLHR